MTITDPKTTITTTTTEMTPGGYEVKTVRKTTKSTRTERDSTSNPPTVRTTVTIDEVVDISSTDPLFSPVPTSTSNVEVATEVPASSAFFSHVDTAVTHFERIGVCIAAAAGGAALWVFADKVMPTCGDCARFSGFVIGVIAYCLMIFTSLNTVQVLLKESKKNWIWMVISATVLLGTVLFSMAGFHIVYIQMTS